jgi:hypothetical protein
MYRSGIHIYGSLLRRTIQSRHSLERIATGCSPAGFIMIKSPSFADDLTGGNYLKVCECGCCTFTITVTFTDGVICVINYSAAGASPGCGCAH